ncbi:MAG: DUF2079 domain-containing protein [Rhodospirillales bacterium]|nr:DUF2079 domain-containing protein [Rhodospirillales bacterium]
MRSAPPDAAAEQTSGRQETFVMCALVALALLMTLKYFPGLENPAAYAGNVFQAIYPDAFPNDPYIKPGRHLWEKSLQLSLMYLPPRIMGEIWLDDRFNALVYLGLVAASLVGLDRIVRFAGLGDAPSRLAIQLVFLRDHQMLNNKVFFAHQADFNHVAFAIPVVIWLVYVTIARKSLWLILGLCVLLTLASIRNAPIVIAMSLVIAAVNGSRRDRLIISAVFLAASAALVVALFHIFPVPKADRLALWDILYEDLTPSQMNPFAPERTVPMMIVWNTIFVALCGAALLVRGPATEGMRDLRLYVGLGLAVWLLCGLYFSFPPDVLKFPQLLPFTPVRILRWPQTLAYLAILIAVFHRLQQAPDIKMAAVGALTVGILLALGPENLWQWGFVFAASLLCIALWHATASIRNASRVDTQAVSTALARSAAPILMQALVVAIGISYGLAIGNRLPAWQTWAKHGVIGDTGSATWIDIAEHMRKTTPSDAALLPLQFDPQDPSRLIATRYIATRSGRSTSVIAELYSMYSLEGYRTQFEQQERFGRLQRAFQDMRWGEAASIIPDLLLVPDYILIPSSFIDASGGKIQPFSELRRVRAYSILKYSK